VFFRDERKGAGKERRVRDGEHLKFGRVTILVREARTDSDTQSPDRRVSETSSRRKAG
jgi:hypothetical protein